jgi:hypothetical protein
MITPFIILLIIGLLLALAYYIASMFISGKPLQIVGIILLLIFLLKALHTFGVF